MKPAAFSYHRPETVAEAVSVLAAADPTPGQGAKVLAGGQSLVPVLNMRLAAPKALVDINRLTELTGIQIDAGTVRLGALVRHSQVEVHPGVGRAVPLLGQATRLVAHPAIRNRGTTVGSLVHADPAAELPAVLLLCDGEVDCVSISSRRTVAAADFFRGPMESSLHTGELAVAARFRWPGPRTGSAFVEVSRRAGDYALCGVGLTATLDENLCLVRVRAAYVSVGPTPVLVDLTEAVVGRPYDAVDWATAAELARARVAPDDDIHASAEYRRHLVSVLTGRAGRDAVTHALQLMRE